MNFNHGFDSLFILMRCYWFLGLCEDTFWIDRMRIDREQCTAHDVNGEDKDIGKYTRNMGPNLQISGRG
jgi:hypothetical protein